MNLSDQSRSVVKPVIVLAGLIIILAGIKVASSFMSGFFLAVFLAILFTPIFQWLRSKGIPAWLAITIMIVGILGGATLLFGFMWLTMGQLIDNLPKYQADLSMRIEAIRGLLGEAGIDINTTQIWESLDVGRAFGLVADVFLGVSNALVGITVILLTAIFIVLEGSSYPERLSRGLGVSNTVLDEYRFFAKRIVNFLVARVKINLAMAVPSTILLFILGVDFALMWGVIAFFSGFIPVVGMLLAVVPPAVLAWVELGPVPALIVVVGYILINSVVENILQPRLMGQDLNLSPVVVFLSLFFWSWILGPLGALLAMPLTLLSVLILARFQETRWLAILLSTEESAKSVTTPEAESEKVSI